MVRASYGVGVAERTINGGSSVFVRLGGVTTAAQVWQIPLWTFKDVDFSRIRMLVYVVEGAAQDGQITVKF